MNETSQRQLGDTDSPIGVGGLALVTLLRLLRSKDRLQQERIAAEQP